MNSKPNQTNYWFESTNGKRISSDFEINGNVKVLWTDSLYEQKTFLFNSTMHELLIYGNSQYALGFKKRRKLVLDTFGVIYLSVPEVNVYNRLRSNDEGFSKLVDKAIFEFQTSSEK